jgi:hypothetical protein
MDKEKSPFAVLEEQGWTRQFIASEPRLSEAVEVYEEAGFQVHLEPLPKEPECDTHPAGGCGEAGACRVCFAGVEDQYRIIFTRPKKGKDTGREEDSF